VDMTRPWKSQNDSHRRLEISHSTRDSHIPTAAPVSRRQRQEPEPAPAPLPGSKEVVTLSTGR
jgi:hypothetical protein